MLVLITGAASSGKSEFAENLLSKEDGTRYYVATMFNSRQAETIQRIEKHRSMRAGKGFVTIERPDNIGNIEIEKESSVLVECLSNLVANEIFNNGIEDPVDYIYEGLMKLKSKCNNLYIVTNQVFEDGCDYDLLSVKYIEKLGSLNVKIANMADEVHEIVFGIDIPIK